MLILTIVAGFLVAFMEEQIFRSSCSMIPGENSPSSVMFRTFKNLSACINFKIKTIII